MNSFNLPLLDIGVILGGPLVGWLFYRLTGSRTPLLLAFFAWLILQGMLAYAGFYTVTDTTPPRLAFVLGPMIIAGLLVGFSPLGESLRAAANLEGLHYLHGVRIVVELVLLHGLYTAGYLAKVVTYEGQNMDILAGLTGPLIGLLVFRWRKLPRVVALVWNIAGVALLLWTISRAVLSAPSPYQQFGFDQPTIAIFYFPFVWLPALIAPLMLWAHFISIKKLTQPPLNEQ